MSSKKLSTKNLDTRKRILEATWHLMEDGGGHGISMSKIAAASGISRQAVYLHFESRIQLVIETVRYVDEVKGLSARLERLDTANSALELIDILVETWGSYIPEIYGLARAMMNTRDTDEATAAAWDDCMGCIKDVCQLIVTRLIEEGNLIDGWSKEDAVDIFRTLLSIQVWEQLRIEAKWPEDKYIQQIQNMLKSTLVKS